MGVISVLFRPLNKHSAAAMPATTLWLGKG
jgi:hypothetical protein